MSNTDSFIEEVSEEVRRDRLYKLMRRYGWIGIVVVLLVVGGATYNEWRKAQNSASAQAFGDSILDALSSDDSPARVSALQNISVDEDAQTVLTLLQAAELHASGDAGGAADALSSVINDGDAPLIYKELASLKHVIILGSDLPLQERRSILQGIAAPGAPFRLLAEEQLALLDVEDGDAEAAIDRLKLIIADAEVTAGLRNRATQLIVALGGELDAA